MGRITSEYHSSQKPAVTASCRECERPRPQHMYAVFWVSNRLGQPAINQRVKCVLQAELSTRRYGPGESGKGK